MSREYVDCRCGVGLSSLDCRPSFVLIMLRIYNVQQGVLQDYLVKTLLNPTVLSVFEMASPLHFSYFLKAAVTKYGKYGTIHFQLQFNCIIHDQNDP